MMNGRKRRQLLTIASIVVAIGIASCSPGLMLRLAVFPYSPSSAFTMKYEVERGERDNIRLYRITANAPVEKDTRGELTTWAVYRFGPFHYAKYYGEA